MQKRRSYTPSRILGLAFAPPALLALTGCSQVSGFGFEKNVSSVNDISNPLWQWAWIAAGVVGLITLILILWPAVFHRKKVGAPEFPKQTQYNISVEIPHTLIPLILFAALFYFTPPHRGQITQTPPRLLPTDI